MPFDGFIKIGDINGDSTDASHKDWIEVLSFSGAVLQPTGGATSGSGTASGGRADLSDFVFTKRMDASSPTLFLRACDAKPIEEVTVDLCRAMGEKVIFHQIKMTDVIVSRFEASGSSTGDDAIPTEVVALRFQTIKHSHTPTDPTTGGKTGPAVEQGWSATKNAPL